MEDSRLIENLVYTYSELIDAGDLEAVADLFKDAEISAPAFQSKQVGREAVLEMYQDSCRIYEDTGTPCTKHLTTNVIIEIEGYTATSRSYFTVMQATKDFPLQAIISGRYQDSFQKIENQWRFSNRIMHVDLMGDCSAHLHPNVNQSL